MSNCIFCRIVSGEIASTKVYEDESVLAFRDIDPKAPTHIVVIPKAHIESVAALTEADSALIGHLFAVLGELARSEELAGGCRVVSNCGALAGQSVPHLHFHLLGGRELGWPPG